MNCCMGLDKDETKKFTLGGYYVKYEIYWGKYKKFIELSIITGGSQNIYLAQSCPILKGAFVW